MKTTKITAILLAAVIAVSAAALLTACGDGDKNATTAATAATAATEATAATVATQPATQPATAAAAQAYGAQTATQTAGDAQNDGSVLDDDNYIDQATAIANVKKLAGTGAEIVSYYKGFTPDGIHAWVVTVSGISATPEASYTTYYSGYQFCYPADSSAPEVSDGYGINDVYFANTSEQAAGFTALNQVGENWIITGTYQSSYGGVDAWAIVMQNQESGQVVTGYVNGSDCYFG